MITDAVNPLSASDHKSSTSRLSWSAGGLCYSAMVSFHLHQYASMGKWSVLRVWDVLLFEGNRVMLFRTALALDGIEQLEQGVRELRKLVSDKKDQEAAMIQVLMGMEQEHKVTEDARRAAEQDAAAQRHAAQVLQ
ncbi:hypothetical protein IGI04_016895, partial [Brassica rapa subsp. trilocularis]